MNQKNTASDLRRSLRAIKTKDKWAKKQGRDSVNDIYGRSKEILSAHFETNRQTAENLKNSINFQQSFVLPA